MRLDDIQNVTITHNTLGVGTNHAWSLQDHSTGATIADNTFDRGVKYEVGMDDSSKAGYQGPRAGGTP